MHVAAAVAIRSERSSACHVWALQDFFWAVNVALGGERLAVWAWPDETVSACRRGHRKNLTNAKYTFVLLGDCFDSAKEAYEGYRILQYM